MSAKQETGSHAPALVADFSRFGTTLDVNAPLEITFLLTPTVSIMTSVFGPARNIVTVSILNGTLTVWSATLTQAAPTATAGFDLILGSLTIKSGATVTLTIPTSVQPGNVFMKAEIQSPPTPPTPFAAVVAQWPLSS